MLELESESERAGSVGEEGAALLPVLSEAEQLEEGSEVQPRRGSRLDELLAAKNKVALDGMSAATLGGFNGGRELARLGISESLSLGHLLPPAALSGLQDTLGAAAVDFTRGAGLRIQDTLGAATLNFTRGIALGAIQDVSEWADMGARAALESLAAGLERQYAETFGAIGRWAEEQQREQERRLAAIADIGRVSVWSEPAPRRRPVYLPEPEPPAEQMEVVQADDQITLESISMALAQGRLPVNELMRLCLQHVPGSKPGRKEPPIPEQLSLVEGWYAVRGRMLQERYCGRVGISKATLNRYEKTCKALGLI